ncbi:MAG TPA: AMP-binding protein, partial [Bacillota bacterium]|nr:AMP-binding protein [Bacillota bacterium]
MLNDNIIEVLTTDHNMQDYQEAYANFQWEAVERNFSWYTTGKVNMAHECIDRHCESGFGDKVALYYSAPDREENLTFQDLRVLSNKFGNVLRDLGVEKGDRVFVFMPRSPELYVSVLGTLKIGAIIGPLFEAFMEDAVRDRLADSEATAIVTTPELLSRVPVSDLPALSHVILVGATEPLEPGQVSFEQAMAAASGDLELEWVDREDGLIMHYTSGSTGKPKGVLHVHNAMIHHYQTALWVLDLKPEDIYWCTADPGWVTGTSYGIFGPWLHGVSSVVRGGRFSADDWYGTLERFKVTVWYSAPTAFRMLMAAGNEVVKAYDLSRVRHVLSVGEPLNPEVVRWGMRVFNKRIHDNWWMTETGGQLISNYPC